MEVWSPEVVVGEALARRLAAPWVEPAATFELLGEGWDNTVWLADGRWVLRFPRRRVAVPAIARHVELLPRLAARLPLPIPVPAFSARRGDGFPWPFTGHELLPGREPAGDEANDAERTAWARPLGEFLRALHDPALLELEAVRSLPLDANRRSDMAVRCPMLRGRLAELAALELWRPPRLVARMIAEAERLPPPRAPVLVHGDLHIRHVLVDGEDPTAVIDWDDVGRADPAIDLVPYWSHLPAPARPAFLEAYGEVGEDQLLRARVLSVFLCGTLAVYGRREGMPALEREAVAALERSVSD